MNEESRERFAAIAALPDEDVQLDEAALLIAAETDPTIDVEFYLAFLDDLAKRFEANFDRSGNLGISINGLIDFIHKEERFSGNVSDFFDPANSYLNRVIDTRQGIPISLALIHISLGNRLNIPVSGINFPGHFLVKYGTDKYEIVDPFSGRTLSKPDCANLLKQVAGQKAVMRDEYLDSADNKDVLIRMLDNLKQIFWRKKSWDESKSCIDRQLLLLPDRAEFNVQLGAVHEMKGETTMAQHAYIVALQATEDEKLRSVASKRLLALEGKPKTVH